MFTSTGSLARAPKSRTKRGATLWDGLGLCQQFIGRHICAVFLRSDRVAVFHGGKCAVCFDPICADSSLFRYFCRASGGTNPFPRSPALPNQQFSPNTMKMAGTVDSRTAYRGSSPWGAAQFPGILIRLYWLTGSPVPQNCQAKDGNYTQGVLSHHNQTT